jgi:cell division protein FtsB
LTQRKIANEKKLAEGKLATLRQDNEELKKSFSEDNLDFYEEKELKLRLGLVRPGERTIIISQDQSLNQPDSLTAKVSSPKSNWQKWIDYFFGK